MAQHESVVVQWSAIYHPEWDAIPEAYLEAGIVQWGRSRRLARCDDPSHALKAYLGVHHSAWGEISTTRFFLSLFLAGRTITLRTFPTFPEALTAMYAFYARLQKSSGDNQ